MSFSLVSQPVNYAAAYKPLLWSFTSSYFPVNSNPGENNIPILEIRIATAADITTFGVNEGDVLMQYAGTPGLLNPYQQFSVNQTDLGLYQGTYRTRRAINVGLAVIDAEWVGDDTGGLLSKVYERYVVIAEVSFSGLPNPVRYELKADPDGIFTMNIMDAAQRGFTDVLSAVGCAPGSPHTLIQDGESMITQTYKMRILHGYILTTDTGDFSFVEVTKGVEVKFGPFVVVNAVQPDNHVDIDGTVDLSWQQDLQAYIGSIGTTGANVARFLTYAPRVGQVVGEDDDAFLAFLWKGGSTRVLLTVGTYDDTNTLIAITNTLVQTPLNSGVICVGPRNLGSIITPETVKYRVVLRNENEQSLFDYYEYRVNRKCGEAYIRPQALNPLGGIDSIGFNIRQRNAVSVDRLTMSKPNMDVDYSPTWTGDFNTRTWAVDMLRGYGVSSTPQTAVMRKFFGENIFTSPDVRIPINDTRWTPIIITTKDLDLYTSEQKPAPIRFDFVLGTDNMRQRR